MDIPDKLIKKKKKREQRFCCDEKVVCIFKSYFGSRCIAPKRVIWRTCRFKSKTPPGGNNGKD